jgi:hypothetical protein
MEWQRSLASIMQQTEINLQAINDSYEPSAAASPSRSTNRTTTEALSRHAPKLALPGNQSCSSSYAGSSSSSGEGPLGGNWNGALQGGFGYTKGDKANQRTLFEGNFQQPRAMAGDNQQYTVDELRYVKDVYAQFQTFQNKETIWRGQAEVQLQELTRMVTAFNQQLMSARHTLRDCVSRQELQMYGHTVWGPLRTKVDSAVVQTSSQVASANAMASHADARCLNKYRNEKIVAVGEMAVLVVLERK